MNALSLLLTLALVDFVAVATPGPNFMLVAQAAASGSRRAALMSVLGVLASNLSWCAAVVLGLSALFQAAPMLHAAAQLGGALYLVYLAYGLWRAAPLRVATPAAAGPQRGQGALLRGYLVGMSNPKSLIYFSSVFTVLLPSDSQALLQAGALGVVALNTLCWYGGVALLLSTPRLQQGFLRRQRVINRLAAVLLGGFGLRLLLARAEG